MNAPDLDYSDSDGEVEHLKQRAKRLLIDILEAKEIRPSSDCLLKDCVWVLRDELLAWAKEGDA